MSKIISNPINTLMQQIDAGTISDATEVVLFTDGFDFAGENVFVVTVGDVKDLLSPNQSVIEVASHWRLLSDLTFTEGLPSFSPETHVGVLLQVRNGGHYRYEQKSLDSLMLWNLEDEDGKQPVWLANVQGHLLLDV